MADSFFNFKEFEDVRIRACSDLLIGNRQVKEGETIAFFDKIQIAGLSNIHDIIMARGGYHNVPHVVWDRVQAETIQFQQGVFSKTQLALLANSQMVQIEKETPILLSHREELESDENNQFTLTNIPVANLFIYNKETGERINNFEIDSTTITIGEPFVEVVADYQYYYNNGGTIIELGKELMKGFVELEGLTRVKDDTTGSVVTGIIRIPKLKLTSDFSIRLGLQASPMVASFSGTAFPVGSRDASYISEFFILKDDLKSDM